jgi:hypothetical protein
LQSYPRTLLLALLLSAAAPTASAPLFVTNDVIAFVGGADVATAQHTGHLESLLSVQHHGINVRYRNFGWEGDTVFEQPRDYAFPSLVDNLQKAAATVVVLQFGRGEALSGRHTVAEFRESYVKLLNQFAPKFRRLILVTPVPFENGGGLLPDLSRRNPILAQHAEVIRKLSSERDLPLVDLLDEITKHPGLRLTSDGLQLTAGGQGAVAEFFARQLGFVAVVQLARNAGEEGEWRNAAFEKVRQAVIAKNRLWFHYSRPQNWAFLGGDRTTQPSSRDHRNPKVRWFPAEMEKFLPLIGDAEKRIDELAAVAAKSP